MKALRTHHLAKTLGVHVNTIRLYEAQGYLPPIPRGANGYREYSPLHMEQARLAQLTLQWPYVGDKTLLVQLVMSAASGDLGMAMEYAYQYLALIRMERTLAEAALEYLERWAAGHLLDPPRQQVRISDAARHLNVSVDTLRNWERNGLIDVPRDPANGYRVYGTAEFGRLRVIRTLVKSGYSLMSVLQMLLQFDTGDRQNLRDALNLPQPDEELIQVIADRWLTSLIELETRAQAIIRQIGMMITLAHSR